MTACTQWLPGPGRHCGNTPTRPYLSGDRCANCTPAALLGQPEPPSTPLAVTR